MLKHDTEKGFVGSDILNYLSELNLYVTTSCKYACKLCDEYHKQYKSCFKPLSSHFLSCHTIKDILEQVKNSSLARINILGGNILLHPEWDILQSVLAGTSIIINIGQAI
ncbi:MAG: hypothetical protein LBR26_14725 [Prevotella sp.]|nr:hypothetical protein [Prevotella sp.]